MKFKIKFHYFISLISCEFLQREFTDVNLKSEKERWDIINRNINLGSKSLD